MAEVAYVSRVRVDPVRGMIRRAHLPAEEDTVLFGAHGEIAEHYGASPRKWNLTRLPLITWSRRLVVDCWAPSEARWQRVRFPSRRRESTPIP